MVSAWLFDPDGTVLAGPEGLVSHLVCGGVYDWSTGLLYQGGRYFDPMLGIWLALLPLAVVQGRKNKRRGGHPWVVLACVGLCAVGSLAGCDGTSTPGDGQPLITVCPAPESMQGLGPGVGMPGGASPILTPTPVLALPSQSDSTAPTCRDFGMTITKLQDTEPAWLGSLNKYGKYFEMKAESDPSKRIMCPLGEEIKDKCRVVQWVEGTREIDGVPVPGMHHKGVYKVDVLSEDAGKYLYLAYEVDYEYDGSNIVRLFMDDTPGHSLQSGQQLDVQEHFVTALYNTEDVDVRWANIQMTRDQVLATPIIDFVEWSFIDVYTHP